ncbi:MAG: transcriptional repressor LexA [Anaerolineae bacterium]
MALSERQKGMLAFIERHIRQSGRPPTIREIGGAVGISSTSVVDYNLQVLEKRGLVERDREVSRGIRLVGEGTPEGNVVSVPLMGVIAAGEPIPVPEDGPVGESIELTREILKQEEGIYALEVKGDSMIDALIHDGDIVVMKHQREASNGDMVAVWIKGRGETTLKRFYRESDRVRLQPANPLMEPIYLHPRDVEIQGKVMVVIRQLNGNGAQN